MGFLITVGVGDADADVPIDCTSRSRGGFGGKQMYMGVLFWRLPLAALYIIKKSRRGIAIRCPPPRMQQGEGAERLTQVVLDAARQWIPHKTITDTKASHPWMNVRIRALVAAKHAAEGSDDYADAAVRSFFFCSGFSGTGRAKPPRHPGLYRHALTLLLASCRDA